MKKLAVRNGISLPFLPALLFLSCIGCYQKSAGLVPDFDPPPKPGLSIVLVSDVSKGANSDVDTRTLLRNSLAKELTAAGLYREVSDPTAIGLHCAIREFDPGASMSLLGLGNGILAVHCDLKAGDRVVGSADARQSVQKGPSMGNVPEEVQLFDFVAKWLVDEIRPLLYRPVSE